MFTLYVVHDFTATDIMFDKFFMLNLKTCPEIKGKIFNNMLPSMIQYQVFELLYCPTFVFEGLLYLNEAVDLREDIKNELQFE